MRQSILDASVSLLLNGGLNGWTVEAVSTRAGCAKGLVNYHFRSKVALLRQCAELIRADREARRGASLEGVRGADALDALWTTVVDDRASGRLAAWLELLAHPAIETREVDPLTSARDLQLALARSLELAPDDVPDGLLVTALLDGSATALLRGIPRDEAQSAFQQAWLKLLG